MRLLQSPNADMKALSIVAPIVKGGTGADNSTEAVQNLGGLNAASLGQANGIAKLNAQGKLDLTVFPNMVMVGPTLNGPTVVYTGQTVDYTITNYDINTAYEVSASVGSLTRSGDTISYTAPAITGPMVLTVNNKVANVSIEATSPIAPSITSPVTGSTNLTASVSVSSTVFAMNTGADTHLSSDWQVATDSAFTNIISSTINDTVNKTSWTATGLSPNTSYYVRVRYKGTVYGYGAWSNANTFSTKVSFIPTNESAILIPPNGVGTDQFGRTAAISGDGNRVILGDWTDVTVHIFRNDNGSWVSEAIITLSGYAYSVCFNNDGSRLIVGDVNATVSGLVNCGKATVYKRTGTTWNSETILTASNKATGDSFGSYCCFSSDGSRVIIGAPYAKRNSIVSGTVYIFSVSGTTWVQEAELLASDRAAGFRYGDCVAIDQNAVRCAISAIGKNSSTGAVYIFRRSGTSWTEEAIITETNPIIAYKPFFGQMVKIDSAGSRVAITAYAYDATSASATSKIFIYSRSGTTWSLEQTLTSSYFIADSQHGRSMSLNAAGDILVVGGSSRNNADVIVFNRSGTTWTESARLVQVSTNYTSITQYGWIVDISKDGSTILITAPSSRDFANDNSGPGIGFIFT